MQNITYLANLIALRFPIFLGLEINDLADSIFAKDVVIAVDTFLKAQSQKQSAKIIKRDVLIRPPIQHAS